MKENKKGKLWEKEKERKYNRASQLPSVFTLGIRCSFFHVPPERKNQIGKLPLCPSSTPFSI